MKKILVLSAALLLAGCGESPEKAAREFLIASQNCNVEKMVSMVYLGENPGAKRDVVLKNGKDACSVREYREMMKNTKLVKVTTKNQEKDYATVEVVSKSPNSPDEITEQMDLIKSGGKWKIRFDALY